MQSPLQVFATWLPTIGWTTIIGAVMFLVKLGWKAKGIMDEGRAEWNNLRTDLKDVKFVAVKATSNHLEHIQRATEQTTQALLSQTKSIESGQHEISRNFEKQGEVLTDLRLVLVDLNGFLRGQASHK